jgi:WD40 repeat protein
VDRRGRNNRTLYVSDQRVQGDSVAWSADGPKLAALLVLNDRFAAARVWDVATRKEVFSRTLEIPGNNRPLRGGIALSPDGKRLAGGLMKVFVWELATGKELHSLPGEGAADLAWTADGRRLVAGGQAIQVWDAESGLEVLTLRGEAVRQLRSLSPDGRWRVSPIGPDREMEVEEVPDPGVK